MFKNIYLKGVMFCLIATISWGTMFPVMTHALSIVDPFSFSAIRYTIALFAFTILLVYKEGISSLSIKYKEIPLAWLFGTLGFASFGFLVFLGQQMIGEKGALNASILMATMPFMGLITLWLLNKSNKPSVYNFLFILLSFVGVILVTTKGDIITIINHPNNYIADLIMIIGALSWVLYTIGASYFPNWSAYKYTFVTSLLGLISIYIILFLLILNNIVIFPEFNNIYIIIPDLLYMSLVAGFIGVLSWNIGNSIITPLNGVLFMDIVPITAFIISIQLGVIPENIQIIGLTISASALIFNNIYQRYRN